MNAGIPGRDPPGTWVLLRGLTRDARHWGEFPTLLRGRFPGAEAVLLDLPGNGSLHLQRSPTDVPALAEFCRSELASRGHRPPYRVLAMSLGGMVATHWASQHPQEFAGLVLITTSSATVSPFWHRLRPANYTCLLRLATTRPDDLAWERAVLTMTTRHHRADADLLRRWVAWRRARPVSLANASRQLLAAARYRGTPVAPAVPLLVLGSRGDGLVHPACSQRLAAQWRCPIAMHPDAGHDLPLDDGPWVVRQVSDWWRGLTGRAG